MKNGKNAPDPRGRTVGFCRNQCLLGGEEWSSPLNVLGPQSLLGDKLLGIRGYPQNGTAVLIGLRSSEKLQKVSALYLCLFPGMLAHFVLRYGGVLRSGYLIRKKQSEPPRRPYRAPVEGGTVPQQRGDIGN